MSQSVNVLEQLRSHLRYAEKEYDIFMLDERRRSRMAYRRNCIRHNDHMMIENLCYMVNKHISEWEQ